MKTCPKQKNPSSFPNLKNYLQIHTLIKYINSSFNLRQIIRIFRLHISIRRNTITTLIHHSNFFPLTQNKLKSRHPLKLQVNMKSNQVSQEPRANDPNQFKNKQKR